MWLNMLDTVLSRALIKSSLSDYSNPVKDALGSETVK